MNKQKSIFGWKNVLCNYGWKSFFQDSVSPIVISFTLCVIAFMTNVDMYLQLKHVVEIGIAIVPNMVALILTAYTIMMSFILSDKFGVIKKTEEGKKLIQDLNSSFAACLLVSTVSIIALIIVSNIANMNIAINHPNSVNYFVFFFLCYLLIYSVSILIGIVIDIYNCGQTTLLDNN